MEQRSAQLQVVAMANQVGKAGDGFAVGGQAGTQARFVDGGALPYTAAGKLDRRLLADSLSQV